MPGEGDPTAVPPSTNPPAPAGSGDTDYRRLYEDAQRQAADWEKRFKGLQPNYQNVASERDQLRTELEEARAQLQTESGKYTSLASQHDTVSSRVAELEQQVQSATAKAERLGVIAGEFPHLLPFIGRDEEGNPFDLLPSGQGDDLRRALKIFSERTPSAPPSAAPPAQISDNGESPPPPHGDNTPETPEAMFKRAKEHFAKGEMNEYNSLMNAYYKALGSTG